MQVGSNERNQDSKFTRAAEIMEQKLRQKTGHKATRGSEKGSQFSSSIPKMLIHESEYDKALKLENRLLGDFEGKLLRNVIPGRVLSNEYGESYRVTGECLTQFKKPNHEKSRQALMSDLKLVYGIGPVYERELKQQGYDTIEELMKHPKWKESASVVMEMIENDDVKLLQTWLGRFLDKSHPLVHCLAGFLKDEDFMLLDIETLGLFGRAIILLGVARPRKNCVHINQYLLRDIPEEPATLWEFISHLEKDTAFVTFNGRAFDVPSIQERLNFYGMEASLNNPHFDLLHFARRAWREDLPDCRLETIEKSLGIQREVDIPSALVPRFYETYLKTGNVGPLVPIVEHNKQDLLTLAALFTKLYEAWDL